MFSPIRSILKTCMIHKVFVLHHKQHHHQKPNLTQGQIKEKTGG